MNAVQCTGRLFLSAQCSRQVNCPPVAINNLLLAPSLVKYTHAHSFRFFSHYWVKSEERRSLSVKGVPEALGSGPRRLGVLADRQANVLVIHGRRVAMIEEGVWHHGHALLDGHPAAEGQVVGNGTIRHVESILCHGWAAILGLVVVGRLVLFGNQVQAGSDVAHQEVASLDKDWLPGHGHGGADFGQVVAVGLEQRARILGKALILVIITGLHVLVERVCHGDLTWRVEAIEHGVCNDAAVVDQLLGSDGPADLPAGGVEKFAAREDRDCPVPVVANSRKADMLTAIKSEEVVNLIGQGEHVRAIVEDIRDLLHLLRGEHFASWVVRGVENEYLRGRLGESFTELIGVEFPNAVNETQGNAGDCATRGSELAVVKVKREHGLERNNGVSLVAERVDEGAECTVGTLRDQDFLHGIDLTS